MLKMMDKINSILGIINGVSIMVIVTLSILMFKSCNEKEKYEQMILQNEMAYKDSLKLLRKDNLELYHRVASVEDLNKSLNVILKERKERIVALIKENISLKAIIDSGSGGIEVPADSNCIGLELIFGDTTDFYRYQIRAWVDNPPRYTFNQVFNPFDLTVFLTRNKDGLWSGYAELDTNVRDFIDISDFDVVIDKDEYLDLQPDEFSLNLFPMSSLIIAGDKSYFFLGGSVLINRTHLIGYSKGIANNWHQIMYGYGL